MTRSPRSQSRAGKTKAARQTTPETGPETGQGRDSGNASTATRAQNGSIIPVAALLFDPDWYRLEYPDVAAAAIDPVRHYFDDGAREGRDPNPFFSTTSYVARYEDVAASRMNPFLHYLLYGAREGRTPRG